MSVSNRHEHRVRLLTTLAVIGGRHRPTRLDARLTPDAVLIDRRGRRLLIGDAKATETPADAATARRLRRYLRVARGCAEDGYAVRVVVCCPGRADAWEQLLLRTAAEVAAPVAAHGHHRIGDDDTLSWIDLAVSGRTGSARSRTRALRDVPAR